MAQDKSPEDFKVFWTGSDTNTHSSAQGLLVYLSQFEGFLGKCGAGQDKFTTTGKTVGELKLFATLFMVQLVDPQLALPDGLAAFMARLGAEGKVKAVMDEKLKDAAQYFI